MKKTKTKILITGANGMLGSEVLKLLRLKNNYKLFYPSRKDLDLFNLAKINKYFARVKPDYVLMIAGRVGGIKDNSDNQYDYLSENIQIAINLFNTFNKYKIKKALYVGSSCIYPKGINKKISESHLLTGKLEPTNEGYAIAKIAGLKLSEYFSKKFNIPVICPMFTNIYGGNDNYNLDTSHVLSALVKKFVMAKKNNSKIVKVWGTGKPKREFIHVSDAARSIIFLIEKCNDYTLVNVGSNEEVSILKLANMIKEEVDFKGDLFFDKSMPDGMLRKRLDNSKLMKMGFKHKISLKKGIKKTIKEYSSKFNKF